MFYLNRWKPTLKQLHDKPPMYKVGFSTHIGYGNIKDEQQDSLVLIEDYGCKDVDSFSQYNMFLGVFDGHGKNGRKVSQWCADNLHQILLADLEASNYADPIKSLADSFVKTDKKLGESKVCDIEESGTTVTVILKIGVHIYVANCGDSRCCVGFKKGSKGGDIGSWDATTDHRPQDKVCTYILYISRAT